MESVEVPVVNNSTDHANAKSESKQDDNGAGVVAKNGNKRGFSSSNDRRYDEKTGRGGYGRFRRRADNQQRPAVDSFDDNNEHQGGGGRSYYDYDRNDGRDFRYYSRMVVRGRGENTGGRYSDRSNYQMYDQMNGGGYGYNKFYAYNGFAPRRYGYDYHQDYDNYHGNYGYGRPAYRGGRRYREGGNFDARRQSSERSRREKGGDEKATEDKSSDEKTQTKSRHRKSTSRQRKDKDLENPLRLTDGILIKIFENMDFETRFSAEQVCHNWMRNMSKVSKPAYDAPTNVRLIVKRPDKEQKQRELIETKFSTKDGTMTVTVANKAPYLQRLVDRLHKIVAHLGGGIAHIELHNVVVNTGIFIAISSNKVESFAFDRCRITNTDFDVMHNFCKIFADKITVHPSTFDVSPKKWFARSKHRRRHEKSAITKSGAGNQQQVVGENQEKTAADQQA